MKIKFTKLPTFLHWGPVGYYSILYGNDCISSVEIINSNVNDFERNGYVLPCQRIFKLNTRGF